GLCLPFKEYGAPCSLVDSVRRRLKSLLGIILVIEDPQGGLVMRMKFYPPPPRRIRPRKFC
ncbi:hypothetical protein L195_g049999, partial [Trifolium pratense]